MQFEGALASEVSSIGAQKLYLVPSNEALGRFVSEVLQRRGRLVSVTPRREGLENLVVRLLEQDRAAA